MLGKATPPKPNPLKKYDAVITKEAKSSLGLFAVHRIDDKIYFEITQEKQGALMMWRAETAKGPANLGYNGQQLGVKFVKFERRENKMFLIEADFDKRSGKDVQESVEESNTEAILASFPIECEGKDRSAVILVTPMYMNDITDIGARRAAGPNGLIDLDKSQIADVKTFPTNIEVRVLLGLRAPPVSPLQPSPNRVNTALVHFSLTALPETPMQGRYYDKRIGYFTESFAEFSGTKPWVRERQYIARFRLEKKDPNAAISEPVKPIVFYLAPEIPEKWRPYFKKGVEDWNPAFEKAGFRNAVVCREPPTRGEDPNWDPEDARHSTIRWVAEPISNAMGPHVHDPRSGEIISAHVLFWHDIVKLVHLWYFVQCSATDERARKFPFPDELTGELLRYVCCHEVGHALGLRHNHRASQAYSIEQLRDPAFVKTHGNLASVMSYGRYNYVAQPEDKIPVKDLIPKLGPYDFFAIEWGYRPVPNAASAESERSTLDAWAARQVAEPYLRFGGEDGPATVDPTVLTENIGNDAVRATELGLKNIDRELDYLLEATTGKGEDFELLHDVYASINTHRANWFGAVLKRVGGVVEQRTLGGRGEQFTHVAKEKQQEAVKFLLDNAFVAPVRLLNPKIVNSLKYNGVATETMNIQHGLLRSLLSADRLNRLLDGEILDADNSYTTTELVNDVQAGIWMELKAETPKVNPLRRDLQRTYIEILKAEFEHEAAPTVLQSAPRGMPRGSPLEAPVRTSELRAVARMALKDLAKQIKAALPNVKDATTRAHLQDCLGEIDSVIEPKKK